MSSTRMMGTCASMGQAVGTAAALATGTGRLPGDLIGDVDVLQQHLLRDDAYIPGIAQRISEVCREASLSVPRGDAEALRDGIHRQTGDAPHSIVMQVGESVTYEFDDEVEIQSVSLVLDTAMERSIAFRAPGWQEPLPTELPKAFKLEAHIDGKWTVIHKEEDNWHRHKVIPSFDGTSIRAAGLRYTLCSTHGSAQSRLYSFLINQENA